MTTEPSLDDVFLDVTGRTRERIAGEVREVKREYGHRAR